MVLIMVRARLRARLQLIGRARVMSRVREVVRGRIDKCTDKSKVKNKGISKSKTMDKTS